MKNLDLNSYGVQEMDAQEVKNVDGGFIGIVICWGICAIAVAAVYASAESGYRQSYN